MASTTRFLSPSIFNHTLFTSISRFWFPLPLDSWSPPPEVQKRWFGLKATPEEKKSIDDECRAIAGPALDFLSPEKWPLPPFDGFDTDRSNAGAMSAPFRNKILEYNEARQDDEDYDRTDIARLLILLLDQMPRNMFRDLPGQAMVYSHYDRLSRALLYSMTTSPDQGADSVFGLDTRGPQALNPARRLWFYLPFMHSEALEDHDAYEAVVGKLKQDTVEQKGEEAAGYVSYSLQFEKRHRDIIEKFNRYPHRNKALGRTSSKEEEEWMAAGGDNFGTG